MLFQWRKCRVSRSDRGLTLKLAYGGGLGAERTLGEPKVETIKYFANLPVSLLFLTKEEAE